MKKLSFVIAIIMILTCMPVVLTAPAAAVDLTIPSGTSVSSTQPYIGYVLDNNTKVYVDTLTHAADIARANIGKQVVLYLEKNYSTGNRIGYGTDGYSYDSMDLSGGADLVIDGQKLYSMKSTNGRFIHFGTGDGTGLITFRNMTIGNAPLDPEASLTDPQNYAEGSMQTNEGSLEKITLKNVKVEISNPRSGSSIVIATDAEFDGVTRDCKNERFIWINTDGISLTIKNSTITNSTDAIYGNSKTIENIDIDNFVVEKANNIIAYTTADKINIFDLNVESSNRIFYNVTADINVNSGTINTTNSVFDIYNGNMVINGGTFTSSENSVFYFNESNASTLTINGGTFTTKNNTSPVVSQSQNDGDKVTTINGGVFNSWNKTATPNDTTIPSVAENAVTVYGVLYSSADTFQVNGGTFNLYQNNGTTFASVGVHALTRGAGYISINGGTFKGGTYVNIKAPNAFSATNSRKFAMPAGGTYTLPNSAITTNKGASVRTVKNTAGNYGIRFEGTVNKAVIDYVKALSGATNVYCGIAIVPASYLNTTQGIFTFDELSANSLSWATANATTGLIESTDKTYYTVRLSLTDVAGKSSCSKEFVAITYVYGDVNNDKTVTTADVVVYSSNYSEPRSRTYIAKAALADVMGTAGTYYGRAYSYEVTDYYYRIDAAGNFLKTTVAATDEITMYSPFTEAQRTVLMAYANGNLPS